MAEPTVLAFEPIAERFTASLIERWEPRAMGGLGGDGLKLAAEDLADQLITSVRGFLEDHARSTAPPSDRPTGRGPGLYTAGDIIAAGPPMFPWDEADPFGTPMEHVDPFAVEFDFAFLLAPGETLGSLEGPGEEHRTVRRRLERAPDEQTRQVLQAALRDLVAGDLRRAPAPTSPARHVPRRAAAVRQPASLIRRARPPRPLGSRSRHAPPRRPLRDTPARSSHGPDSRDPIGQAGNGMAPALASGGPASDSDPWPSPRWQDHPAREPTGQATRDHWLDTEAAPIVRLGGKDAGAAIGGLAFGAAAFATLARATSGFNLAPAEPPPGSRATMRPRVRPRVHPERASVGPDPPPTIARSPAREEPLPPPVVQPRPPFPRAAPVNSERTTTALPPAGDGGHAAVPGKPSPRTLSGAPRSDGAIPGHMAAAAAAFATAIAAPPLAAAAPSGRAVFAAAESAQRFAGSPLSVRDALASARPGTDSVSERAAVLRPGAGATQPDPQPEPEAANQPERPVVRPVQPMEPHVHRRAGDVETAGVLHPALEEMRLPAHERAPAPIVGRRPPDPAQTLAPNDERVGLVLETPVPQVSQGDGTAGLESVRTTMQSVHAVTSSVRARPSAPPTPATAVAVPSPPPTTATPVTVPSAPPNPAEAAEPVHQPPEHAAPVQADPAAPPVAAEPVPHRVVPVVPAAPRPAPLPQPSQPVGALVLAEERDLRSPEDVPPGFDHPRKGFAHPRPQGAQRPARSHRPVEPIARPAISPAEPVSPRRQPRGIQASHPDHVPVAVRAVLDVAGPGPAVRRVSVPRVVPLTRGRLDTEPGAWLESVGPADAAERPLSSSALAVVAAPPGASPRDLRPERTPTAPAWPAVVDREDRAGWESLSSVLPTKEHVDVLVEELAWRLAERDRIDGERG